MHPPSWRLWVDVWILEWAAADARSTCDDIINAPSCLTLTTPPRRETAPVANTRMVADKFVSTSTQGHHLPPIFVGASPDPTSIVDVTGPQGWSHLHSGQRGRRAHQWHWLPHPACIDAVPSSHLPLASLLPPHHHHNLLHPHSILTAAPTTWPPSTMMTPTTLLPLTFLHCSSLVWFAGPPSLPMCICPYTHPALWLTRSCLPWILELAGGPTYKLMSMSMETIHEISWMHHWETHLPEMRAHNITYNKIVDRISSGWWGPSGLISNKQSRSLSCCLLLLCAHAFVLECLLIYIFGPIFTCSHTSHIHEGSVNNEQE